MVLLDPLLLEMRPTTRAHGLPLNLGSLIWLHTNPILRGLITPDGQLTLPRYIHCNSQRGPWSNAVVVCDTLKLYTNAAYQTLTCLY
jgi:hypothetical protein